MIVTEIIHETKQRTLVKARRNGKKIIITGCVVAVLLTTLFYAVGIPQKDPLYSQFPLVASMPLILMSSFNAVGVSSIMFFFLWALGESTRSQVKTSLEQRRDKKIKEQATAVRHQITQYGQQDYSLQIDEAKAGLEHQIIQSTKDIPAIKIENKEIIAELSEWKKFTSDIARRFSIDIFATKWEVRKLRNEVSALRSEVATLKREKSEKEQEIEEKAHAHNNTENTKSLAKSNKIEFLDE